MSSRNLARPIFPLPPDEYSREYMDRLVQSFAVYLEQYQNPGEGRTTKSVMTNIPTTPVGSEDGTVWVDSTILRVGTGGTPGTFVIPNLEVTTLLDVSGTLDITGVFDIAGTTVTASAVELNYNDITTLGTVEENKTVTAGTGKAINFDNAPMTNVDINSGAIDGTPIGTSDPAAIAATTGTFGSTVTVGGVATFNSTATFNNDVTVADRIIHGGDTDTQIRFPAADQFSVDTNGEQRLFFNSTTEVVFNDPGNSYDFRVESITNANMLFVDASANRIGVGTNAPTETLDVRGSAVFNEDGADADFRVESDNSTHMLFVDGGLNRVGINASVPAATLDVRGSAIFNDAGGDFDFRIESDTNANMFFVDASTNRVGIGTDTPAETLDVRGSAVFNEDGADADFRIESDTNANMFFVDASTNRVGIGVNTPIATLDVAGDLLLTSTGGLGYGAGSGGAVTQDTSRTTGVTLNKTNGAITLVSAAGTTAWQTFTVTNNTVAATDVVVVNQKFGTDMHMIHVTAVAAGSFNITFATTGGATTEQPVFSFAVIKAVTS